LRSGIALHNGGTLTPQMVVTTLSVANPDWRVRAEQGDVVIQSEAPQTNLLTEVTERRNSICLTDDSGHWIGSGPFRISVFQPGQTIDLRAFDDAWQGRPFVDEIRIQMGKPLSDQAADLQLNKADLIEGDYTQQPGGGSSTVAYTRPNELFALAFSRNHLASSNVKLREALADSVDRNAIYSVLLQRLGEPAGALLPEWISGYAHLFGTMQDLGAARQLRIQAEWTASLSLAYDGSDSLAKLIAERVSVNAKEAGITIQPRPESPAFRGFDAELRLVRLRLQSPDRVAALSHMGDLLDINALRKAQPASSIDALYGLERDVVNEHSVIPLAYVPESFVAARGVHDFKMNPWGEVNLGNLWIEAPK
jgi:ABC-type transport system substrate-binding protein